MKCILITDEKGKVVKKNSIAEAAKYLNVTTKSIRNWLTGENTPKGPFAGYKFEEIVENDECAETLSGYEIDPKTGKVVPSAKNIKRWLLKEFETFRYNELTDNLEVNGDPIDDLLVDDMCIKMEEEIGLNNDKKVRQCITSLCLPETYNPLKEKIESFTWDGEERAEEFFIRFLGAKNTKLNRKYTRCWLKAAIKRLYEPGCMWDQMFILFDKTGGTGKTKIFERLSLHNEAKNIDIGSKDGISVMNTAWMVNFDELARFDKKDMNALKTFITTRSDVNRLAYARYAKEFKRHCVFCGSTNDQYFLRDYTSERERRFWIVDCKGEVRGDNWWKENLPDEYIHQLWAEVKSWYDTNPEIEGLTIEEKNEELLVQASHKSFNKDPKTVQVVKSILDGKFSQEALRNFKMFRKEALAAEVNVNQTCSLDKLDIGWLAGTIDYSEEYTKAMVMSHPGWVVQDGYAVRTSQLSLF